ncbi:MAG: DUF4411 family protein [Verrucomicrobiota bacterium]
MNVYPQNYVIDTNVFVEAHRRYYPFDICPGFWSALCWWQSKGRVCSVAKVKEELTRNDDTLCSWSTDKFGDDAFISPSQNVVGAFSELADWVNTQNQFQDRAKAEFSEVADGWVIAHAKATGSIVVTHEGYSPEKRNKVPMPNVCQAFNIEWISSFEMLRRLGVTFNWTPSETSGEGA